jgi:hypothetical protein
MRSQISPMAFFLLIADHFRLPAEPIDPRTAMPEAKDRLARGQAKRRKRRSKSPIGRGRVIEIQVRPSRKWWISRTGAERTFGYVSTGSAESCHLQAGIT